MICPASPSGSKQVGRGFRGAAVRRLAVAAVVGVIVGVVGAWFAAALAVLAAWDSAALVLLAWILIEVMRLDPEQTSIHATTDGGRQPGHGPPAAGRRQLRRAHGHGAPRS